jgi:hypothetical protein
MTTITIKRDVLGDFSVFFQSRDSDAFADLVSSIKCAIPPGLRTYRPAERCWQVDASAKSDLDEWVRQVHHEMPVKVVWVGANEPKEERQQQHEWPPPRYRKPTREELLKRLHLLPDAPAELIKAAYRTLAQMNHPDHGGNEETMKLLNEAFQLLAA